MNMESPLRTEELSEQRYSRLESLVRFLERAEKHEEALRERAKKAAEALTTLNAQKVLRKESLGKVGLLAGGLAPAAGAAMLMGVPAALGTGALFKLAEKFKVLQNIPYLKDFMDVGAFEKGRKMWEGKTQN